MQQTLIKICFTPYRFRYNETFSHGRYLIFLSNAKINPSSIQYIHVLFPALSPVFQLPLSLINILPMATPLATNVGTVTQYSF